MRKHKPVKHGLTCRAGEKGSEGRRPSEAKERIAMRGWNESADYSIRPLATAVGRGLARASPWRGGCDRKLRGKRRDFLRPLIRCSADQLVVVYQPACQQGRDGLLEPLIQQRGDFLSKVGCVVQSRQLKVAEAAYRCRSQKLPRRIKGSHAAPPERYLMLII